MSYTRLTCHCTFSTKERVRALDENTRARLHPYLAGIIDKDFGHALQVGGTDDHVHVLCDLRPTVAVADFLRDVKSVSSGWMHREFPRLRDVTWQDGYAAFSVSASATPAVVDYIQNQRVHHQRLSFQEEFRLLLEKHGIEFDERYLL